MSDLLREALEEGVALVQGFRDACFAAGSPTVPTAVAEALKRLRDWQPIAREALAIEPTYEYRAVSPVGTADPDETGPVRATAEDARDDLEHYFGLEPDDEQWIERSPVRTWERVQ